MRYRVVHTNAFKRDYKRLLKRGLPMDKLHGAVAKLANGEALPASNRDHALTGEWGNHRECHIAPDWLLIYQIAEGELILELTRSGSHSDLFG